MAQWMNLHQNNSFINRTQLPLFYEISEAIHLVLVGLTTGRQANGWAGRQANEIHVNFKFLKKLLKVTFRFV